MSQGCYSWALFDTKIKPGMADFTHIESWDACLLYGTLLLTVLGGLVYQGIKGGMWATFSY